MASSSVQNSSLWSDNALNLPAVCTHSWLARSTGFHPAVAIDAAISVTVAFSGNGSGAAGEVDDDEDDEVDDALLCVKVV